MKRQNFLRFFVVIALAIVTAALVITGCGESAKWKLTWEIDEHAQVTVDGHDGLPEGAADNEVITFSVEGKDGYAVAKVTRNGRVISAANGKYSLTVTADTTVKVETEPAVKGVKVTKNPTKLTYYAGEQLDRAGMEVSIEYETGATEPTTAYTVVYAGGNNAAAFGLGDTSFSVRYGETVSDPVNLSGAVVALVTIDLDGATVTDEYMGTLTSNTELSNVKTESGILTFTFAKALTKEIKLPTAEQIAKGEEDDYVFIGWSDGVTSILASTSTSVSVKANFLANLVSLSKVYYSVEEVGGEQVPYLVLEGTFKAAEEFYLYLYEGNAKISLTADTMTGKRGDKFVYKFDMRKLAEAKTQDGGDYSGKWMDIKVQAVQGSRVENMDIDLNRYSADFVDRSQRVEVGEYTYFFQTYSPSDGVLHLKAVYSAKPKYEYTITGGVADNGNLTLTFSGATKDEAYIGYYARVDFEIGGSAEVEYGLVGADSKWTVTFELNPAVFTLNTNCYAHFNFVQSETDGKGAGYKDNNDSNMNNNACLNDNLVQYEVLGDLSGKSLRIANDDETVVYYVGEGAWGGVIMYGVNEKFIFKLQGDIALKVDNMENATKVYYVITAAVKGYTEDWLNALLFGNIDGSTNDVYESEKVENLGDGVYRLWFDVTAYGGSQLWPNLYVPGEEGATPQKFMELKDADHSVNGLYAIAGGKKYMIGCAGGAPYYDGPCMIFGEIAEGEKNPESADPEVWPQPDVPQPAPTLPEGAEYAPTDVTLEATADKMYFVLSGTYLGCTEEEIKAYLATVWFDLQSNQEAGAGNWDEHNGFEKTVTAANGTWTIKYDITAMKEKALTAHFDSKNGEQNQDNRADLKIDNDEIDGRSAKLGLRTFTLVNKFGSDKGGEFWGCVGIVISDERTYTIDMAATSLQLVDGKPCLILKGTCSGYTEKDFLIDLQENDAWDYTRDFPTTAVVEDGNFTVTIDLSKTAVSTHVYLIHALIDGVSKDMELPANAEQSVVDGFTKSVTVGTVKYTLKITRLWDRNMITIAVENV